MLRKILILFLMGTLLVGAAYAGISIPVLLLMGSLLLIALLESSVRNEPIE
jgi:hypothetical protein